jgi:hypothetical protein
VLHNSPPKPTDASNQFKAIQELFAAYANKRCPPQTDWAPVAGEAAAILRELEFLDHNIVEAFDCTSRNQVGVIAALIDDMIKKDPDSELVRAVGKHPELRQFAFASTQSGTGVGQGGSDPTLLRLQIDTCSFYERAHRPLDLLPKLPSLNGVRCDPIEIVRNQINVHAGQGSSNRTHWSFGFSTGVGPRLRPFVIGGDEPSHTDSGYFPNRDALLSALQQGMKRAAQI